MKLIEDIIALRYYIKDSGKYRRHRYSVVDRLSNDLVLAKFDELQFAENTLKLYQDNYRKELEHEHLIKSVSAAENGSTLSRM